MGAKYIVVRTHSSTHISYNYKIIIMKTKCWRRWHRLRAHQTPDSEVIYLRLCCNKFELLWSWYVCACTIEPKWINKNNRLFCMVIGAWFRIYRLTHTHTHTWITSFMSHCRHQRTRCAHLPYWVYEYTSALARNSFVARKWISRCRFVLLRWQPQSGRENTRVLQSRSCTLVEGKPKRIKKQTAVNSVFVSPAERDETRQPYTEPMERKRSQVRSRNRCRGADCEARKMVVTAAVE